MLLTKRITSSPRAAALPRCRRGLTVRPCASAEDGKFADYKPTFAAFFPGQGAQSVGMAKDLVAEVPAAKELFARANDIVGYDLLKMCTEGPKDKLDSTEISQPAIYVASMAALEKLRATEGQGVIDAFDVTCGLSLGEYTALAFADAVSFEDGLRLVKLRGESMQAAANAASSGMVSVVGLDAAKATELCEAANKEVGQPQGVKIANYLCPGNYTVSGSKEACDAVEKLGKSFKARMTVRLAVAGAFHTEFMRPAAEKLQAALADTSFKTPRIPVISNVDAQPHSDPEVIKSILTQQLTSSVQWEDSMKALLDRGLGRGYEIGPGKVIAGISRRIAKDLQVTNITA